MGPRWRAQYPLSVVSSRESGEVGYIIINITILITLLLLLILAILIVITIAIGATFNFEAYHREVYGDYNRDPFFNISLPISCKLIKD